MSCRGDPPPPLPAILAELAAAVGHEAALKIAAVTGGTRIYLPARVDDDHWLVQTIGRELADRLTQHFAVPPARGQRVDIPLGPESPYRTRLSATSAAVRHMTAAGKSSREIATLVGISQRTVHAHRAKHRRERGQ